jgi:uncharacterized damage-inducible protein DinB
MSRPILSDAFEHHAWATVRLIDACADLPPDRLDTKVPGTYGSIIDTLRHLVGADSWYLYRCSGGRTPRIEDDEEATMDLAALRTAMMEQATGWRELVARPLDPDAVIVTHRDDGSETHAPLGIRLAQVLHHGTDHRSQVCTALTSLGVEPPLIDVWDFGGDAGRVTEIPPTQELPH